MKILTFLVIVCFVTGLLPAQTGTTPAFSFDHMALSVKDVDRSAGFYSTVLMLPEITNRSQIPGIRWFKLEDGRELHLISVIKENVTTNKAIHLGLSMKHFEAFVKRLNQLKLSYCDWAGKTSTINIRADSIRQVYFQDPDGYWIEVNSVNELAPPPEQVKNQIWELEEHYWKYVKEKNIQAYISLWDDNFIGYPSNNIIGNKAHITDWLTELYKDTSGIYNYKLSRKVENVFDNIVIVLYDVSQTWTDDKGTIVKTSNVKITHTWKQSGNKWLIIGGMGANK